MLNRSTHIWQRNQRLRLKSVLDQRSLLLLAGQVQRNEHKLKHTNQLKLLLEINAHSSRRRIGVPAQRGKGVCTLLKVHLSLGKKQRNQRDAAYGD